MPVASHEATSEAGRRMFTHSAIFADDAKQHRKWFTYKDIRGQSIDFFTRRSGGCEVASVEEGVPGHSVVGGVETPRRTAGEARRDGAVSERIV